ncbi:MAG: hypothetical protein NC313_15070 [Butyrivibrio sp.]|nr:hypothetical protein [Butyrivibrio sp.]
MIGRKDLSAEDQYIQEQFDKNFLNGIPGNIVIYGTGLHTQELLKNVPMERIIGLMDAAKTGETMFGKKVLSYDEVAAIPEVYIVIIARNSVINVIYRRIEAFVSTHGIPVFDINGKRLCSEKINDMPKQCFQIKETELLEKMGKADVVSFDIFDTLLCRCVMRPSDVFNLMDLSLHKKSYLFSTERTKAESQLPADSNYSIYDIYRRFQENTGERDFEIKRIMELEIETEKSVLKRRESMCRIFNQAVAEGKCVYLVSDMYLDEQILSGILKHFQIEGYKKLYVSTDYKSSKQEELFKIISRQEGLSGRQWLHVGDNFYADICMPKKYGIDTFRVYSTMEMLEQSIYAQIVEKNHSLEENIVIARFAAMAFNSPFGEFSGNGKLRIAKIGFLADLLVAPLIMKYMAMLISYIDKQDDVQVLFPSRDGYVLKQIYDGFAKKHAEMKMPESVYLYTSRRAALVAAAQNEENLDFIINLPDSCSISERIHKRFGVALPEEYDAGSIPKPIKGQLMDICQKEREYYARYLEQAGFYKKKSVFVDFVAVGTVQDALQRMTGRKLYGYYFYRREPDNYYRKNLICESLYPMAGDFETNTNVYKYYYFLENVLSSYEPTFMRCLADGGKEFYKELRSDKEIDLIKQMHCAILQYCEEMFDLYPDVLQMAAGIGLYDEILGFFSNDYTEIEPGVLEDLINYDELFGKKVTELNR